MHTSRKKSPPSEVSIRHAKNGGFVVKHSYDNSNAGPSYQPPDEYAFANHAAMIGHITTHTQRDVANDADADDQRGSRGSVGNKGPAPGPKTHGAGVD